MVPICYYLSLTKNNIIKQFWCCRPTCFVISILALSSYNVFAKTWRAVWFWNISKKQFLKQTPFWDSHFRKFYKTFKGETAIALLITITYGNCRTFGTWVLYFQVKNKSNQSYLTVTLLKCSCCHILVIIFDCQLVQFRYCAIFKLPNVFYRCQNIHLVPK